MKNGSSSFHSSLNSFFENIEEKEDNPPLRQDASKGIFHTISKTTSKVADDVKDVGKVLISRAALSTIVAATGKFFQGYSFASTNASLRPMAINLGICQDQLDPWMQEFDSCTAFTVCQKNYKLTPLITGSATLGGIFGAFFAASVSLRGRRFALIAMNIVAFVGLLINTSAFRYATVAAGRLILGVAMGSLGYICPQYVSEIAPPASRGRYVGITDSSAVFGILVATMLGLAFNGSPLPPENDEAICGSEDSVYEKAECGFFETDGDLFCSFEQSSLDSWWWRIVISGFALPVVFLALMLLLFVFKFETPYWLMLKGRFHDAKEVLKDLRDGTNIEKEFHDTAYFLDKSTRFESLSQGEGFISYNKNHYARRAIWTGIFLGLGNAITGDIPMSFLTVPLFLQAGITEQVSIYLSVFLMVMQLCTVIFVMLVADKFGRKPLLIIGASIQTTALFVPSVALIIDEDAQISIWLAVLGTVVFTVGMALGLGSLVYTSIFEMFPPHMSFKATRICVTVTWIGNFAEFLFSPLLTTRQMFVKSAFLSFCALMVCIFLVKETKGLAVGASPYFPDDQNPSMLIEEKSKLDFHMTYKFPSSESENESEDSDSENSSESVASSSLEI